MLNPDDLFGEIDRHFLGAERLARVEAFKRAGRGVEGWFRGETVYLLQRLASEGKLGGWQVNAPITQDGKQRCDLRVDAGGGPLWIEIKGLHFGSRAAMPEVFSGMSDALGVTDDVVRLLRIPEGTPLVLMFVYPRPEPAAWRELLHSYQRRINPIRVEEQTSVEDYPASLYVCKLAVSGGF
jgi:hypothetical protein